MDHLFQRNLKIKFFNERFKKLKKYIYKNTFFTLWKNNASYLNLKLIILKLILHYYKFL